MADGAKVVINLATGLEDPERVTVAFLVGGAAAEQGKQVAMFLTKEAVRLAVPGVAEVVGLRRLPAARPALRTVRRQRRRTACMPDLRQVTEDPGRLRGERSSRRRHPSLGMDRGGGGDRLQLLGTPPLTRCASCSPSPAAPATSYRWSRLHVRRQLPVTSWLSPDKREWLRRSRRQVSRRSTREEPVCASAQSGQPCSRLTLSGRLRPFVTASPAA
jgi:predicted peroxiredoxin